MDYDARHQVLVVEWEPGLMSVIPFSSIQQMEPCEGEALPAGPGRPRKLKETME